MKTTFAELFRELREEMGLGQMEMSTRVDIAQSKLSMIETGKVPPNGPEIRAAIRLAEAYAPKTAGRFKAYLFRGAA